MCGISGIYSFSSIGNQSLQRLAGANDVLHKRGPDCSQVFSTETVALGHRRLSIIDISHAGNQPMSTADGRFTIVFNGEIFNYRELKSRLTREERESLRSASDTEVFLLLYARLKVAVFSLLRGFFAAAIYDNAEDTLVLVRDRFGKKPLVYYADENQFCFASEMKALFAMGIPRRVNWEMLPVYLQLNYVPQPSSFVQGVLKVPQGHYLQISKKGIECKAYYTLAIHKEKYTALSYEKAQEELVTILDEAVRLRLISDVPLGAFLSGGIDSSVIVALASRYTQKLQTFSIGYRDNPFFDETRYAKLVADRYKTEHTVFSLGNDDFLEHVHSVMDYLDEPFADSSAIPVYILSYHTRKHVTVSLSGDGGDEIFAGYNKHMAEYRMRQGGLLSSLVKASDPILSLLPKSRNNRITNKFRQLARFASGAKLNPADRYWRWASINSQSEAMQFLHKGIREQIEVSKLNQLQHSYTKGIYGKDFNEVLLADMNLVLLSDMLTKVDMMSMGNSLEIRSPFLDSEVVEFGFSLPPAYKIDGKMKKRIVQDAFRDHLPAELYNRPKQGFEIPLLGWFRNELWGLINDELLQDDFVKEQGVFDLRRIQQLKKQLHSKNPGDSHATIWALLVFQNWWKKYM